MGLNWSKPAAANELNSISDHRCYINSPQKKTAYEWHLNDKDNSALKKANVFRFQYEKLYIPRHWLIKFLLHSSAIVKDSVYTILKGYLEDIDTKGITDDFETAGENSDPMPVFRAYSRSESFIKLINGDMAKNVHHELILYGTPLNCNVLTRTHDGIQAFITIMFHPELNEYLCNEDVTVYRGAVIDSECSLQGYKKGAIIISTTFLSTSEDLTVAKIYSAFGLGSIKPNQISLLCKYKLHNYRRMTLKMKIFSQFPDEEEVLIYPYVPFRILSFTTRKIEQTGEQQIEVDLEEIGNDKNDNSETKSIWTVSTDVKCETYFVETLLSEIKSASVGLIPLSRF